MFRGNAALCYLYGTPMKDKLKKNAEAAFLIAFMIIRR